MDEIVKEYVELNGKVKRLLKKTEHVFMSTDVYQLGSDEYQQYVTINRAIEQLEDLSSLLNILDRETLAEGHLSKQSNGRYELEGYELSSGHPIEIWIKDEDLKDGGYFQLTRIEHHNDYYAVYDEKLELEGLRARLRR